MKFVTFSVYNQKYAIEIKDVEEVLEMLPYVEVPHTYDFIEGVVQLRGEIIPVVNLRKKFGISENNSGKNYLIIVSIDSKKYGLKVDTIEGVIEVDEKEISSSRQLGEISSEYIKSVIKKQAEMYIVIDIKTLIGIGSEVKK
ncbi:MAG: chemotaxis protein CheW [Candidatus Pelagibacter ubique]